MACYDIVRSEYQTNIKEALKTQNCAIIEEKARLLNSKYRTDLKSAADQAFRDVLFELLELREGVFKLQQLLQLCIEACKKEVATPTTSVVMLGDIFDNLTLELCEEMFGFIEERVNLWREPLFFSQCKNNLLRLCNDLLKRLSRSSATVFCGRILLFLAQFFPFSERSGLNIISEFNLENLTEYGANENDEPVTEIEVPGSSKTIVIDYSLYCKFWSLQDFFRNPNQCYNKVQWKLFCSHANHILNTFEGLKLDYGGKEGFDENLEGKAYFSKYLTNQKLLDLQLYDVNFRRYVLLQFLILFQYLTSTVRFKADTYELKSDQKEWVQSMTDKVYTLLGETPPDGERFGQIVKSILHREEYWNNWKNNGCPEFKLPVMNPELTKPRKVTPDRPLLGDILKEAHSENRYYMGSNELTKLWNLYPNNLEACKAKDRDFLPSLEEYFAEAIDMLESKVKSEELILKDGNFGWRALRLLARRSPHFFTYSNNTINQLPDYLQMMVKKIAADRPDRNPNQESNNESMETEQVENLFKEESTTDVKVEEVEEFVDDHNPRTEPRTLTVHQVEILAEKVGDEWKRLATKLGFRSDEIKYFEDESSTDLDRTKNVLQLWFEDDVDATPENLAYILEGLGMIEAAEVIKNESGSADST